jgi:hypothetical protein
MRTPTGIAESASAVHLTVGGRPLAAGDYLCSERDLYRVEQIGEGRALIEDCRTGGLLGVPLAKLLGLRLVREA